MRQQIHDAGKRSEPQIDAVNRATSSDHNNRVNQLVGIQTEHAGELEILRSIAGLGFKIENQLVLQTGAFYPVVLLQMA